MKFFLVNSQHQSGQIRINVVRSNRDSLTLVCPTVSTRADFSVGEVVHKEVFAIRHIHVWRPLASAVPEITDSYWLRCPSRYFGMRFFINVDRCWGCAFVLGSNLRFYSHPSHCSLRWARIEAVIAWAGEVSWFLGRWFAVTFGSSTTRLVTFKFWLFLLCFVSFLQKCDYSQW